MSDLRNQACLRGVDMAPSGRWTCPAQHGGWTADRGSHRHRAASSYVRWRHLSLSCHWPKAKKGGGLGAEPPSSGGSLSRPIVRDASERPQHTLQVDVPRSPHDPPPALCRIAEGTDCSGFHRDGGSFNALKPPAIGVLRTAQTRSPPSQTSASLAFQTPGPDARNFPRRTVSAVSAAIEWI